MRASLPMWWVVVGVMGLASQSAVAAETLETLMVKHSNVDINNDGVKEINWLRPLSFEVPEVPKKGVVVVLVESRLLGTSRGPDTTVINSLSVLRQDMVNEGFSPRFIEASVYAGAIHQDGRTVLALRRFLKDVRANMALKGCVLVGDFPDASLVRRVMLKDEHVTKVIGGTQVTNAETLTIVSEQIAVRADLVLSDLDGNWEALYEQGPRVIKDIELLPGFIEGTPFPYSGQSFVSYQYNTWEATYADFFYIGDESTTVTYNLAGDAFVSIQSVNDRNPELSSADLSLANPIAQPEIEVTRINARHVGVMPVVGGPTLDGLGALAADGKPRAIPVEPDFGPWVTVGWARNAAFERRLLLDYLARNHRFRTGGDRLLPYRTGAVRSKDLALHGPAELAEVLKQADPTNFGTSQVSDNAGLETFIAWLKTPMTLRGVSAHADWVVTNFAAPLNPVATDASIGGRPWNWRGRLVSPTSYLLEPTTDGVGDADVRLYRTMWENQTLANAGQSFWLHHGCSVNSVSYGHVPYSSDIYGYLNNAEAILFYANALEVMARAKVYNDVPRGFGSSVFASKRFSSAFAAYTKADGADPVLNSATAPNAIVRRGRTLDRKRSYFWGVLGDLTLRLRY